MADRITDEQMAYIAAHLNDRPRVAVARAVGVSYETVRKWAKVLGGEVLPRPRRPERELIVRENCAGMTFPEIDAAYGFPRGCAAHIARRLGLRHSPETAARIAAARRRNLAVPCHDPARRAAAWRKARRMDQQRMWLGLRRRTKHRFAATPKRVAAAKHNLRQHWGYAYDKADPYVLRYAPRQRRSPNEALLADRHGIRFLPASVDGGMDGSSK